MLQHDMLHDWRESKFFIVHVPKTGGTSLFDWFSQIFGQTRCCEHIEAIVLPTPTAAIVDHLAQFDVISGHVPIDYSGYFADDLLPVTIMREPAAQFFSHVNHIRTEHVGAGLVRDIQDKLNISTGYFLEHATAEQLAYFENPQSRTIFSGNFDWRRAAIAERLSWLQATYAAVLTTETMDTELAWLQSQLPVADPAQLQADDRLVALFDPDRPRKPPGSATKVPPRLNVKHYRRQTLTLNQVDILRPLLREDRAMHAALMRCSGVPGGRPVFDGTGQHAGGHQADRAAG